MKKHLLRALILLLLLFLLPLRAYASEVAEEQWSALQTEELEKAGEEALPGLELDLNLDLGDGLRKVAEKGLGELERVVKSTLRTGVLLLLATLLCGVLDVTQLKIGGRGLDLTALAGTASILALAMTDVSSLATLGRQMMEELESFSKVLLPTLTAAAVASGNITGAAVRQSATLLFSDVLLTLMNRVLLPLVYLYTGVCAGYAAVGNQGLRRIGDLLKWGITVVLTAVVTAYVTWLGASSAIAGKADALTMKTASFAISTMVPVVGRILSSATETVVAGAGVVKNAVGIFGLIATLAFCVIPFLQMGIHYLVYKVTSALSATLSGGRIAGLIGDIGTAFGLILAMNGAGVLVLLISLMVGISATVG
jgi:stage III sporulation protein AE